MLLLCFKLIRYVFLVHKEYRDNAIHISAHITFKESNHSKLLTLVLRWFNISSVNTWYPKLTRSTIQSRCMWHSWIPSIVWDKIPAQILTRRRDQHSMRKTFWSHLETLSLERRLYTVFICHRDIHMTWMGILNHRLWLVSETRNARSGCKSFTALYNSTPCVEAASRVA